jgi:hypothetical protein
MSHYTKKILLQPPAQHLGFKIGFQYSQKRVGKNKNQIHSKVRLLTEEISQKRKHSNLSSMVTENHGLRINPPDCPSQTETFRQRRQAV